MATPASAGLLTTLVRPLVAALNAWSYSIARSRADRRRRKALADRATAARPLAPPASPRWPSSWGK